MKVTIYQPKDPYARFRVNEETKHYFKPDYDNVYEIELDDALLEEKGYKGVCEYMFDLTNRGVHPEGYKGYSLSVGDIVEIATTPDEHDCAGLYAYICDSFGWNNILLYDEYFED